MFQKKLNEKVRGTYKNLILYTYSIFFVCFNDKKIYIYIHCFFRWKFR